jgi:hypothetical protein
MYAGIADMRVHLRESSTHCSGTPMLERILVAVEAHLRHELELSDYTTASIRNSGQIPDRLRTRQRDEEQPMAHSGADCSTKPTPTANCDPNSTRDSLSYLSWAH